MKGLGRRKGSSSAPMGQRVEKPFIGLSCPVWHLKKTRSFRRGGGALGYQKVGCQGIPDQAPHFPVGSRREREEERRRVRCGADIAVGGPALSGGITGEALPASWRGCAGCWHSQVMLCPGFRMWPCEPALVWAENTLQAESGSRVSRDIRCPFLSSLFHAVPLCFPLPCHKHPAWAGGRKQTLQSAEGARPAPCEPSARDGEVEVIPQCSQEVPLKSSAAAGSIPQRISHRVFPACPSQPCPTQTQLFTSPGR